MKQRILVAGSTNTDMVIQASHFPKPGETVIGRNFFVNPGGKGANQAVAAARLGGSVLFLGKTGNDQFGKQNLEKLENEGVNTTYMLRDNHQPSGIALITVNDAGENSIVVASGANATLLPKDFMESPEIIEASCIVLLQLEIPLETVEHIASLAFKKGAIVILNPSPVRVLSSQLLSCISILVANTTEAESLSGLKVIDLQSAQDAAYKIREKGVKNVIITLGKTGALILHNTTLKLVESPVVNAIDSTAAGDVFIAALAVGLSEGKNILKSCEFVVKAAAISVTRLGAQSSAPFRFEIEQFEELIGTNFKKH